MNFKKIQNERNYYIFVRAKKGLTIWVNVTI